jgi:hypothetical protein
MRSTRWGGGGSSERGPCVENPCGDTGGLNSPLRRFREEGYNTWRWKGTRGVDGPFDVNYIVASPSAVFRDPFATRSPSAAASL